MNPKPRLALLIVGGALFLGGCPQQYRQQADQAAQDIVKQAQKENLGHTEPFTIERPADILRRRLLLDQDLPRAGGASLGSDQLKPIAHWPEKDYPPRPTPSTSPASAPAEANLVLSLTDSLQVAARNNPDYQSNKEDVFRSALALDLQANKFRNIFSAGTDSEYSADYGGDDPVRGMTNSGTVSWQRQLENGMLLTANFTLDLVNLLTADRVSSMGLAADATMTVPLLRGSGRYIVMEDLTQAQRNMAYSLLTFERYRQTLSVRVASDYLGVLQQLDQVRNADDNYRGLLSSTRRTRRLAAAGRLPQIQVDQSLQDELRARERWIAAQQSYARRLDTFKNTLGLPTDARIELDRQELQRLHPPAAKPASPASAPDQAASAATQAAGAAASEPADEANQPIVLSPAEWGGGPLELAYSTAVDLALKHRTDLRTALGKVYDAQRQVVVAADALGPELTLTGSASAGERRSLGSAGSPDARLRPEKGLYRLGLTLDLPLERTAERTAYRDSYIALERAVRDVQNLEDQLKLEVRDALRGLLQARASYQIQVQALAVAQRRVESTKQFLEAGRAETRDVLEAQEALVSALNAVTAALVSYRVSEMQLQRDMGVLEVDEKGNWHEYTPADRK